MSQLFISRMPKMRAVLLTVGVVGFVVIQK